MDPMVYSFLILIYEVVEIVDLKIDQIMSKEKYERFIRSNEK